MSLPQRFMVARISRDLAHSYKPQRGFAGIVPALPIAANLMALVGGFRVLSDNFLLEIR
jgi:hypothetical protein